MTEMASPERRIDARCDRYVDDYAVLEPLAATYFGISGHDHELPDLSLDGFAAREEVIRRALADVRALTAVDAREQAAKDAFEERLTVELDQYAARAPQSRISVVESQLHSIRGALDLMDTSTEESWATIAARLAAVPAALVDYRATLASMAADGHVSARQQISEVVAQIRGWTRAVGGEADFFTGLGAGAVGPDSLRAEVAGRASAARGAFADFATFLERELLPHGRPEQAVGREQYAVDSRYFLGTTIDLDETYDWGWHELRRIEDEMLVVAQAIGSRAGETTASGVRTAGEVATIDGAVAVLDADPRYLVSGAAAFRDWMQELADRTIGELGDVHFDIPDPIRRIQCRLAPTHDGGIYYTGPTEDFSRPGQMWWEVPEGIDTFSTWREVTTVYHEGVPGHHLQVAQTAYRSDLLNRWQRLLCWVSGHGEGWALYAERLMDDLGYLDDPADKLGMLDAQGLRAARVIIDIGMHLELEIPTDNPFGFHPGETWTPALGLEFMRQHCRMNDAFIRFEVSRYLGWPGQAPAYKVGERIWLAARAEAQARQGSDFDLKAFHRAALDLGSLGLDPMRAALARL